MCVFDELRKVYIVKIQSNLPVFPKISVLDTKSIKDCRFSESKRLTPVNSTFLERQIEVELPSAAQNYVDTGSYLSSRRARMPIPGNTTSLPLRLWHQQHQILDDQIKLYLDDYWLPPHETSRLIRENDCIK